MTYLLQVISSELAMEFRRRYDLRAFRPIRDSTFMMPQAENYSLFATPFLDIKKKVVEIIEVGNNDKKILPEQADNSKSSRSTQSQRGTKKSEEDEKKPPKEPSEVAVNFGIVLNVATLEPEQLTIKFKNGNEIEVDVNQSNFGMEHLDIYFERKCKYTYELPDGVDQKSLVALRTSDDYLIIFRKDLLRMNLLIKSKKDSPDLTKYSDKDSASSNEATESAKNEDTDAKKTAPSKKYKPTISKEPPESKVVFSDDEGLKVVPVTKVLRLGLDIFMLRKYIGEIESYVSIVRKFIENASFVSENSKTAKAYIRHKARAETDSYDEDKNKERERFNEENWSDSGYDTAARSNSESLPADISDESSIGSF